MQISFGIKSMPTKARRQTEARPAQAVVLVVFTVLQFAQETHGLPFLHTPNAGCAAPTKADATCPIVCARSVAQCPSSFTSAAVVQCTASGGSVCVDGSCAAKGVTCDNANLAAVCACPKTGFVLAPDSSDQGFYFPCSDASTISVNASYSAFTSNPQLVADQPLLPVWRACAVLGNFNAFLESSDAIVFNECTVVPATRVKNPLAPEFLCTYIVMAVEIIVLFFYYLAKTARERNNLERPFMSASTLAASSDPKFGVDRDVELQDMRSPTSSDKDMDGLRFTGYMSDPLGSTAAVTVAVTSFIWMILLTVLVLDYYAVFSGFNFREESDLLFNDHELLSSVFIVSWHFVLVWFLGLKVIQDKSDSYFSKRVPISEASMVQVEKKVPEPVAIANMGSVAEWVRKIEAKARIYFKIEHSATMVPVQLTSTGRRFIEFECVRYVYDERNGRFQPYSFTVGPTCADLHTQSNGLTSTESRNRSELVGPNAIAFPADTFYSAMGKEFSGIFYVYQMMSLWVWMYYGYYYMGVVLTFVIVSSGISKVQVFLTAQRRVLSMANFTGTVKVLRNNNEWHTESTEELVPGDVIEIVAGKHVLPVDAVLVDGGAVCDESSLTGEALPVVKFPVKNDANIVYSDDANKSNTLFAGCFVLEAQPSMKDKPVRAIVTATGAVTSKGRLVKDILFPTKVSFVFQEHLKVVFGVLMVWGVVMLFASVLLLGTTGADAWFYGMFTISQILSPLLPAVLVIGQSVASERLAKKGILCVDLDRITLSGKVKVYCFDKTGTLTKEGLNFLAIQPVLTTGGEKKFGPILTDYTSFPQPLRTAMLTCHSVTMVGSQQVGNFVDVEMFRVTDANLGRQSQAEDEVLINIPDITIVNPSTNGDTPIQILKRFEFVHSNAYMTVLIHDPIEKKLYLYLKGSFEKIREICDPLSLPDDAEKTARHHASEGCYVLGFARREIPAASIEDVVGLTRAALEQKGAVSFIGLCMFRNELKPDTMDALHELRDGGCRVVMITGDNIDTGVFVARKCGMIESNEYGSVLVVMGDLDPLDSRRIVWKNTEDGSVLDEGALMAQLAAARTGNFRPMELAVTGKCFNTLLDVGSLRHLLFGEDCFDLLFTLKKNSRASQIDIRVFARMSPDDKVMCVRLHMEKAITAMCGDGGNDAGALKAAHSGIALSEAESSVVAHFSSRDRSIFSCVELLREARCALDVSFASYKYLIMYGEVLALVGLIQYYFNVNMSQAMWILIDGTTVPLSWALTQAIPSRRLARTRPTARLLGPETLVSVVGMIVINVIFGIASIVMLFGERTANSTWFQCKEFDGNYYDIRRWWELADNFEGEVSGIVIVFQIVNAAAIFSMGRVYRADPNPVSCLFHINCGTANALELLNINAGTNYRTDFLGIPDTFYAFWGHNVMPMQFRLRLW
ncbi:hypothetical protein HK100_012392, partial [Physocladia obscura]